MAGEQVSKVLHYIHRVAPPRGGSGAADGALPEHFRAAVVLCYLEGRTYAEAARQLGWSRGTLSTRLTKARELLRARLAGRGVHLSGGLLAGVLAERGLPAALSPGLAGTTL